jgi:hypothetical protein
MFIATSETARSRTVFLLSACLLSAACGCSARTARSGDSPPSTASQTAQTNSDGTGHDAKHATSSSRTVELVLDYGDGVQKRFTDIGWKESMTVLDVLKSAQEHLHGISFSARGSGETVMVTKLDDVTNQGGATDAKNWIFRINGRMGDESCGIAKVRPGDTVLWKFGPYE